MRSNNQSPAASRLRAAFGAVLAGTSMVALLVACGGGGDVGSGTFAAQSFASGPITGLGSVIVNGVRFDDSSAKVESADDSASHNAGELKLGMMVEIQAGKIDDSTARATAATIRFGSELVGAVQSIDTAATTLTVLDQIIEVKPTTVYEEGLAGFSAITSGQILEIHAQFDAATGHYVATRIESEAGATAFRLRGKVSALDATAKTFKIGNAVINFGGIAAADLPVPALANDQTVRVRLQIAQVNGQWVATSVRSGVRKVEDMGDARVRGLVTVFTSSTSFEVGGVKVDATNASFVPNADAVKLGALVEVRGTAANGGITATQVRVRNPDDVDLVRVELHGTVSALDTTAKTFTLRTVKVDYSKVVEWKNGVEAELANDKQLEVKGVWSADHTTLIAAMVEFGS